MRLLSTQRRVTCFPFRRLSGFLLFLSGTPAFLCAEETIDLSTASANTAVAPQRLPPTDPRYNFSLLNEPVVFKPLRDWGTKITVSTTTVNGTKSLLIQYDLSRGERVECFAPVAVNLARCGRVRLVFQGEGPASTLDIRLTDSDGTTVGYSWSDQTKSRQWTASEIPFEEMTHFGGGDRLMDWTRVSTVQFTISKSNGGRSGRGHITLKDIKFF